VNRVLVTGGAGFIGSHTCDLLRARNYEVRVLDCLQPRVHPRGRPAYLPADLDFVQGDVRDRSAWQRELAGVRTVFHLAAYQDYMPDFSTFMAVNACSTALLIELIVEKRLPVEKIVLASSQSVYGEGQYVCAEHGVFHPGPRPVAQLQRGEWEHACPRCGRNLAPVPFDESVVHPHTAYGISKYASELLGMELGRRYGIPTVALRYSIVQGPRNSLYNAYSGVCRTFTQRLLNHKPAVVYEDGQQLRDYVHVRDVAAAHLLVLKRPECDFQVFNVGGVRAVSVLEFARIVAAQCGADLAPVRRGEFRVGDTRHTVSDSGKLRKLGWAPRVLVEGIVADYVNWVRAQGDIPDTYEQAAREMRQYGVLRPATVHA
jgi:dTDP-L-rhamnose 4-epimerase